MLNQHTDNGYFTLIRVETHCSKCQEQSQCVKLSAEARVQSPRKSFLGSSPMNKLKKMDNKSHTHQNSNPDVLWDMTLGQSFYFFKLWFLYPQIEEDDNYSVRLK